MTRIKATQLPHIEIYDPEKVWLDHPTIQYERGMSDGSRDKRDGETHAVPSTRSKPYQDGYRRGWMIARTTNESN